MQHSLLHLLISALSIKKELIVPLRMWWYNLNKKGKRGMLWQLKEKQPSSLQM